MKDEATDMGFYVEHRREERFLEYKGPMVWTGSDDTKVKIAQAMLAMCNLKDGGVIVVGMKEDPKGVWEPVGMTDSQATSFAQDDIAQWVNDYAVPAVQFTVSRLVQEGKTFVAIQVREFDRFPTICRKQMTLRGQDVLRRGAIYYRSNSKNESAPISSEEDMRELITLATMKVVGQEIARLRDLGLVATLPALHEDSALKYQQEREGR